MTNHTSDYILHVSDFHLDGKHNDNAKNALITLARELNDRGIQIRYLIHTGDVIDSKGIHQEIASKLSSITKKYYSNGKFDIKLFQKKADSQTIETFNDNLKRRVRELLIGDSEYHCKTEEPCAKSVLKDFLFELNISPGNVVICCGNHDAVRLAKHSENRTVCLELDSEKYGTSKTPYGNVLKTTEEHIPYEEKYLRRNADFTDPQNANFIPFEPFDPFEDFLDELEVANSSKRREKNAVDYCTIGDLRVLILNTNWEKPEGIKTGYSCVWCSRVRNTLATIKHNQGWSLPVVVSHKPLYEICEAARLSYRRYRKTTFMAALQEYIGSNGIYLCGDKHTRGVTGSSFHDIPHYIGGEPLATSDEVEYNLVEVIKSDDGKAQKIKTGMERVIHLKKMGDLWTCKFHPTDKIMDKLFSQSKDYIIKNTFELIDPQKNFQTWDSLFEEIHSWGEEKRKTWLKLLNEMYASICKFRKKGFTDTAFDKDIFMFIGECLSEKVGHNFPQNVLNVRGEYSSGKSTFLGLLYIFLMTEYSIGNINFIPAYFNLENKDILSNIQSGDTYFNLAQNAFKNFAKEIQDIASVEHQPVLYILDGIDEQDCWSYSSEDSIGRGLLDILSQFSNAWYMMSYSQQRLPCFKNTMPVRRFNDQSDILYFNPINVRSNDATDQRYKNFVNAFFELRYLHTKPFAANDDKQIDDVCTHNIENACEIIRNFRRLTINQGFMFSHDEYIAALSTTRKFSVSVTQIYKYYIDYLHDMCMLNLGYGFVLYAPAMAFLFACRGYTYEKFRRIAFESEYENDPVLKGIGNSQSKIYKTFQFIKKQKDAREYLIALHYNKELRYYVEHPDEKIRHNSILNEFMTRDTAVIIRKLWTDSNKFIIVCNRLLKRDELSPRTQSMLIYCLSHMQLYEPIRVQLLNQMYDKAKKTLKSIFLFDELNNDEEIDVWEIEGKDKAEYLNSFLNLSLLHTIAINNGETLHGISQIPDKILTSNSFRDYNLQFQMLYYGDLFIRGEDRQRPLIPRVDVVGKGFDFHNCFNYLSEKLRSGIDYPLKAYDLYTLCSLFDTRLNKQYLEEHTIKSIGGYNNTFFFRAELNSKACEVLTQARDIFTNPSNHDALGISATIKSRIDSTVSLINERIKEIKAQAT